MVHINSLIYNRQRGSAPARDEAEDTAGTSRPTSRQLERELERMEKRDEINKKILHTLGLMAVIAAAVVLALNLWFPVLQVQRSSMSPTLTDGDMMIFTTAGKVRQGDIVAFHHGSQVLIKRVIAVSGDWIDIDADGVVYVNGEELAEQYVSELSVGECTVELPMQVQEDKYFVMGDHRLTSLDSRSGDIGLVHRDQIIGKSMLRIWPIGK